MEILGVVSLPAARRDLLEIGRYIARDNPPRAESYCLELTGKTKRLVDFPELGRRLPRFKNRDIRQIIHGNYRIIYRVKRRAGLIEILRFWHAARREPTFSDLAL